MLLSPANQRAAKSPIRAFIFVAAALAHYPQAVNAQPACSAWVERNLAPPPNGSFVYDDAISAAIYYSNGETWKWDYSQWTNLNIAGPPPRENESAVYDAQRGVILLFGGNDSGSNADLGDTWEFDGTQWHQLNVSGPAARGNALMCYDRQHQTVLLYGGFSNDLPADYFDLWEWDGENWTRHTNPPDYWPELAPQVFAFDSQRGVAVLIGSDAEVWEWDDNAWSYRGTAPLTDSNITGAFSAADKATIVESYGSSTEPTWSWDGVEWHQVADGGDSYSVFRQMTPALNRGSVLDLGFLFPHAFYYLADVREFTGTNWNISWNSGPNQHPSYQYWPAMAFDSWRGVSVMFSGYYYAPYADTWEWNGENWNLRSLTGPDARQLHAMAFDSTRGITVMFGGIVEPDNVTANCCPENDTWEWDGLSWTNRVVDGPGKRYGHAMVYDEARGVTVLFGGATFSLYGADFRTFGDTWEWDGHVWTQVAINGPPPREGHGMAYDSVRGVTVLFGGYTAAPTGEAPTIWGDTWEWDGNTWKRVAKTGPPPRAYFGMAYDNSRHIVVLEGGGNWKDTWEWDDVSWKRRLFDAPVYKDNNAMVYDSWRDETISFGWTSDPTALWVYSPKNIGADSDGDLIADECDQCPASLPGIASDSTGCAPADADLDGDADLLDFAAYQNCQTGDHPVAACTRFDLYPDTWMTVKDFAIAFTSMSGPVE